MGLSYESPDSYIVNPVHSSDLWAALQTVARTIYFTLSLSVNAFHAVETPLDRKIESQGYRAASRIVLEQIYNGHAKFLLINSKTLLKYPDIVTQ